ncbi:hypothetical protein BC835DRAFT_1284152 [Cytidiella melzeri]|nr:hypothetical protein BC835DRAFT_1284152 [Cytidiella melzeri]
MAKSSDFSGSKLSVGWRRYISDGSEDNSLFLADPNTLIVPEDRDSLEPPSSSYSYAQSWSASQLTTRDVWDPKILTPGTLTVWKRGSTVTVTWDTSNAPQHPTNTQGTIYLGHVQTGETNEHLDTAHPLAQGFSLAEGTVQVQVPSDVSPGADYIIVLMGDSGNRSPTFRIE